MSESIWRPIFYYFLYILTSGLGLVPRIHAGLVPCVFVRSLWALGVADGARSRDLSWKGRGKTEVFHSVYNAVSPEQKSFPCVPPNNFYAQKVPFPRAGHFYCPLYGVAGCPFWRGYQYLWRNNHATKICPIHRDVRYWGVSGGVSLCNRKDQKPLTVFNKLNNHTPNSLINRGSNQRSDAIYIRTPVLRKRNTYEWVSDTRTNLAL